MVGSSPGSPDGDDDLAGDHHEKKRQPGVKRACNECRQQKVSLRPSVTHHSLCPPAQINQCQPYPILSTLLLPALLPSAVNAPIAAIAPPWNHYISPVADHWLSFSLKLVAMRCRSRPLHELLQMRPSQARLQDRVQLQARRQAQQTCRDGKGDRETAS